nr:DALR anticodon-binding domain-containing protein [Trichocoleus sp. FACHB-46]
MTYHSTPQLQQSVEGVRQELSPVVAPQKSSKVNQGHIFDPFAVQYTHARCCSLLRLAREQGLLAEESVYINSLTSSAIAAPRNPWLNSQSELRLVHPAEQSLIFALIDTVDELQSLLAAAIALPLEPKGYRMVERLVAVLAKAFLSFYDACRFWGHVQQSDQALVQARLGLVLATQPLLQVLIQEVLGLVAPTEL